VEPALGEVELPAAPEGRRMLSGMRVDVFFKPIEAVDGAALRTN
jgi:hypothetical protein